MVVTPFKNKAILDSRHSNPWCTRADLYYFEQNFVGIGAVVLAVMLSPFRSTHDNRVHCMKMWRDSPNRNVAYQNAAAAGLSHGHSHYAQTKW